MSVAIDIAGVGNDQFVFCPSPLAELGAVLHAVLEPEHHVGLGRQLTAISSSIDADLMGRLAAADFLWRTSRADILLPAAPAPDLSVELDGWDRLDDEAWTRSVLITSSCGSFPAHDELRSPLVDARSREVARERAAARSPRQVRFVDGVLADPGAARRRIRGLLEDSAAAFFDSMWADLAVLLGADARIKQDRLRRHGLAQVLQSVSPAVSVNTTGDAIVIDKLQDRRTSSQSGGVTFLPSIFGHPHLLVVNTRGWRPVVQYPVETAMTTSPTTSLERIRRRIHALDHPIRIRLARSLLRGAQTTSELAKTWNLTAPEVSRHLAVLKRAGLITGEREGRYVRYALDLPATARLGATSSRPCCAERGAAPPINDHCQSVGHRDGRDPA